ncbi:MAG TPA: hypothetical protein PLX31_08730, partial [Gemmatimonadaceae bacterium]|nr:hypothetical protein [Gemmatimonadaceae bacterium]
MPLARLHPSSRRSHWRSLALAVTLWASLSTRAGAQARATTSAHSAAEQRALAAVGSVRIAELPWTEAIAR